jgi:hypothetical protein
MSNTTKFIVEVTDGGSSGRTTKNVKELRSVLVDTEQTAARASKAISGMKGPGGGGVAAAQAAYGTQRGTIGTGAAARDFAKEAQGLGGAVKLYATYAANIFAVSAAFTALDNAMKNTRLFEASEMLGNTLGLSMKGLATDIQAVTGYAISMQEALKFANMGTSVGLTSKAIKELTVIAKGAANVLGRDSGDAISRIITGTAKQEQEILDELGIFVKATTAYEEYAKRNNIAIKGSAAETLTAQEKVVAYSEAVAAAGQKYKQFAKVEDPFAEFIAKGKEALQTALEFINNGVVPIIKALNDAQGAIISLGAYLSLKLFTRALPEIGGAISNFFTFDKNTAADRLTEASNQLIAQYEADTARLVVLKAQRDALIFKTPKESVAASLGSAAQIGTGKNITPGASISRIASGLYGADGVPKFTAIDDITKSITSSLQKQLDTTKQQKVLLDSLIKSEILHKDSTLESVQLGTRGLQVAEAQALAINKTNEALAKKVALEAESAAISSRMTSSGITIPGQTAPVGSASGPVVAATAATNAKTTATKAATVAAQAQAVAEAGVTKALSTETVAATAATTAIMVHGRALATSSELAAIFTTNMGIGARAALKGFARTIAVEVMPALTAFSAGLIGVTTLTGILSTTLGALFRLLGTLLGPILLLVTAYELFGDSILKLIGLTGPMSDKLNELNTSIDKSTESTKKYTSALLQLNAEKSSTDSIQKQISNSEREFKIYNERIDSIQEQRKQLELLRDEEDKKPLKGFAQPGEKAKADPLYGFTRQISLVGPELQNDARKVLEIQRKIVEVQGESAWRETTKADKARRIIELKTESLALEEKITTQLRNQASDEQRRLAVWDRYRVVFEDINKQLDVKTGKLPFFTQLDRLKDTDINKIGGEVVGLTESLDTSTLPMSAKLKGLREAIAGPNGIAEAFKKATGDGTRFTGVVAKIDAALKVSDANRKGKREALLDVRAGLGELTPGVLRDLETSPVNVKALGKPNDPETVKAKNQFLLQEVQKRATSELETEKKKNDALLSSIDNLNQNKLISDSEYFLRKTTLIEKADASESAIILKSVEDYTNAKDKKKQDIEDAYKTNVASFKNNEQKLKQLAIDFESDNAKLREEALTFEQKASNRLEEIASTRIKRLESEINRVSGLIAQSEKAFKGEEEDRTKKTADKQEAAKLEQKLILLKPKEAAGVRAEFEANKEINDQIYKRNQQIKEQSKGLSEAEKAYNAQLTASVPNTAAIDNYDRQRSEIEQTESEITRLTSTQETYATAAKNSAEANYEISESLSNAKKFQDQFEGGISQLSDAIVDFAFTGKQSFGSMIESMILGLIKMQMQMQLMAAFNAAGGGSWVSGLANVVGSFLGPSMATAGELNNFGGYGSANSGLGAVQPGSGYPGLSWNNALGGVYDQGRVAFAKGGAFTNTIVTKPTTFAFAKGTGLMGESGPEAIMPLKRGANGSLGVQSSGGGNVDVVVNNYGSEKATTKESTDSRGNRRIEVIVGEMTATEMSRPNSPVQTSMRSTFGLAPTLTRR